VDEAGGRVLYLADGACWRGHGSALGVAYVPGRPFYPGDAGATQIRLAYSRVADHLIDEGVRRIGEVLRTALEGQ